MPGVTKPARKLLAEVAGDRLYRVTSGPFQGRYFIETSDGRDWTPALADRLFDEWERSEHAAERS